MKKWKNEKNEWKNEKLWWKIKNCENLKRKWKRRKLKMKGTCQDAVNERYATSHEAGIFYLVTLLKYTTGIRCVLFYKNNHLEVKHRKQFSKKLSSEKISSSTIFQNFLKNIENHQNPISPTFFCFLDEPHWHLTTKNGKAIWRHLLKKKPGRCGKSSKPAHPSKYFQTW